MRGGVRLRGGVRETDDYTDRERERPTCGAAGLWGLFPGRRSSPRKSGHPQLSTKKVWSLDGVCLACVAGWWLDVAGYPVGEIADLQMHAKTKSWQGLDATLSHGAAGCAVLQDFATRFWPAWPTRLLAGCG